MAFILKPSPALLAPSLVALSSELRYFCIFYIDLLYVNRTHIFDIKMSLNTDNDSKIRIKELVKEFSTKLVCEMLFHTFLFFMRRFGIGF